MKIRYVLGVVVVCVAGIVWFANRSPSSQLAGQSLPNADALAPLIKQGEYLARAADCTACHSAKGGQPYAGGLDIASPLGTIYSTNITPDKNTGIGNYSLEDFDRALRHGVAKGGHTLYPAMPYASYAHVAPDDVKALYAFFMHGVAPVSQANKDTGIRWPMSMRWPLGLWRAIYAPKPVNASAGAAVAGQDQLARGKYLVEGLGHCGACHTPRGLALQEKALGDADGSAFLSGNQIDGWVANNLRGDPVDGLGSWSREHIVAFLKSGRNAHSAAFGGMADVVGQSTQHMSDADLNAIAAYLKNLPPRDAAAKPLAYDDKVATALFKGTDKSEAAITFLDNCAACHRTTGKGYAETFPALALSATLHSDNPASIIRLVLQGSKMPGTAAAPTRFAMPAFDWRLTDQEVAGLVTFVRGSWGNQAPAVSSADVARIRKELGASPAPLR
jgi:mono/diheme cytochrome c family protein